jgi:hypothetical protein
MVNVQTFLLCMLPFHFVTYDIKLLCMVTLFSLIQLTSTWYDPCGSTGQWSSSLNLAIVLVYVTVGVEIISFFIEKNKHDQLFGSF